jgi:UDP:flavonoid glycosyltransferase YjiC (YdhE family)
MKMVFFPSDRGGGFGHISRCLILAQEARNRGHACGLVLSDTKYEKQIGSRFPVFVVKPPASRSKEVLRALCRIIPKKHGAIPLYVGVSGLDFQVVRDGLVTEEAIEYVLKEYEGVLIRFKPDVLIGDANLLVWILSHKIGVPVLQIVRYASHPATAKLIWWEDEPYGLTPPNSSLLFNPILDKLKISSIERAENLLRGDMYLVPSIPEIEPIPSDEMTVHVGQLSVSETNEQVPAWFRDIDGHRPLVYVTIGGGAGPVGNKVFFQTAIEALANKAIQVVVSTSVKFNDRDFPYLPKNIRMFQWVPGRFLISRSDLIVFHGGYGTMMECIAYGKPSIIVPFQTEQEGNGRRLEQLRCGRVVRLGRDKYKQIRAKWRYGTYSFLVQNTYDLKPDEFIGEVNEVLFSSEYLNNAQRLQSRVKQYHGSERAVELIEERWA